MDVYISINGVLRNLIKKFDYEYQREFLDADFIVEEGDEKEPFVYETTGPLHNDNLLNHYKFQSIDEFKQFLFVDFPLEIFGHATLSYMSVMIDLNKLIYENPHINFTLIGLDEYGKAKSSTLFFLSKYSYLGNSIKFIKSEDITKEWKKCDMWVTDNKEIIDKCPKNKTAIKYITEYNDYFTHKIEIENLSTCLKSWEMNITSTWIKSLMNVTTSQRLQKKALKQSLK